MTIESLTYAEIGDRLGITPEAARKKVKGLRLPTALGNDGKTRVSIDFSEIQHSPKFTRRPGALRPEKVRAIPIPEMQKLIDVLRAEIALRTDDAALLEELRLQAARLEVENADLREQVLSEIRRGNEAMADRDAWRSMAQRPWWKRLVG